MGKIKQGILGGFSGTVGTVVGGNWKGINYMRSKAQKVSNPKTDGQMSQRTKFALALNFLKPMGTFLRTGFKLYSTKQTPFNAAMSYTLANAISGTFPDYSMDYSLALVTRGPLTTVSGGSATIAGGNISVSWSDNSGVGDAKQTDKSLIVVLNPLKNEAVYETAGADRMTGIHEIALPADWMGDSVEVFVGFISEDAKAVSNSVYLGSVVVA